jgi:Protein of unknown function (DUF3187)
MRVCFLVFLLLWITGLASARPAFPFGEGGGPFPTRNYNPVQLLFLSLPPEKANPVPHGMYVFSVEVAESNTILSESTDQVDATLKFETFRSAFHLKYGLSDRLEVGLEIPFFYRNGGFFDPFIVNIENNFGKLNPDRIHFKNDEFGGYEITQDGELILSGENHQTGWGDISLSGKYLILHETTRQPAISLRVALKFPTGDFDRAYGSGKADIGLGLVVEKSLGRRWLVYLNQSVVDPGDDFGSSDLTLRAIYSVALAVEFMWTAAFSLVGQFDFYTSPFHGAGARVLDNGVSEVAFGLNYRFNPHLFLQLYGIENFPIPRGAYADFTAGTKIAVQF